MNANKLYNTKLVDYVKIRKLVCIIKRKYIFNPLISSILQLTQYNFVEKTK